MTLLYSGYTGCPSNNNGPAGRGGNMGSIRWVLALASMFGTTMALAQTATPAAGQLEEVVVTATRRSESLQDVPMSITALNAATLEQRSVKSFIDYAGQVPSLAFADTGDGSGTARTISIRGVSGDNTTGFYIDETPVPDSIDPRVIDVERIEVLRGPQGTLYGARSMGGTVRMITTQPGLNNFTGRVRPCVRWPSTSTMRASSSAAS